MFHYAILLLLLRCCHIDGLNYTFIALFLMPLEQKHPATISLHCFFLFNTCFFPLLRCEFSYVVDCFFFFLLVFARFSFSLVKMSSFIANEWTSQRMKWNEKKWRTKQQSILRTYYWVYVLHTSIFANSIIKLQY